MSNAYTLAKNGTLTESKLDEFLKTSDIDAAHPSNHFTLLVEAARNGHPSVMKSLLAKGANVNKKGRHGRTPLHHAIKAKRHREKTIEALLDANADVDSADDDGNTPLMAAITATSGLPVVRLLVASGASTTKKNEDNHSAIDLANLLANHDIKRAVLPGNEHAPGRLEFVATLVNLVLFILAYVNSGAVKSVVKDVVFSLYHIIGNSEPDSSIAEETGVPETVDDFKDAIEDFVTHQNPELSAFFAPGNDFFQKVAEKAVELKDDPNNHLKTPDQIKDLTRLALYQPILYCDDSSSMIVADVDHGPSRQELARNLATRMCSIATRLVPDGDGVHLRFINKRERPRGAWDSLNKDQIDNALRFAPNGNTPIGTVLHEKVLQPYIFDVFARGETLKRPILIMTITDGCPTAEEPDTFRNAVVECGRALVERGYEPEAVRFLVSRIGTDEAAVQFLDGLAGDTAMDRVVHRTSGRLDRRFLELHKNEAHVEEWLLNVLMSPIIGTSRV